MSIEPAPMKARGILVAIGLIFVISGLMTGPAFNGGDVYRVVAGIKQWSNALSNTITPESPLNSQKIRRVQLMLSRIPGVYPEHTITGNYGSLTKDAVSRFQREHRVTETGMVDADTYRALENASGLRSASSTPYDMSGRWESVWEGNVRSGVNEYTYQQNPGESNFSGTMVTLGTVGTVSVYGSVQGDHYTTLLSDPNSEWICYNWGSVKSEGHIEGTWQCPAGDSYPEEMGTFSMVKK